ncbi:MAG TPA: hypothetical protein VKR55_10710 [Bradyrhizobium sp.]|uniref:hypothetical protein n=1 Tax=Bradyrhizobium sp. TaxID=376 RepID=UPI002C16C49C|nr:hypothetical protein [Bradyrhizobium sp.]HLZ02606.1 hypothetical protein [Bradyrhizobium sp.]
MTNWTESSGGYRNLTCSRCGAAFACNPLGACWCKDETVRLPMPVEGEDCLCRECLRKAAEQASPAPR